MQKEQQKRPYLAPEIVSVEFAVEIGEQNSFYNIELQGPGVKAKEEEAGYLMFLSSMQNQHAQMGEQMGYFGPGSFTNPDGSYFGQ